MRHAYKKKVFYCGIIIIILIIFLHPDMNTRKPYEYIDKELISESLHEETAVNFTSIAILECDYQDVLFDDTTLSYSLVEGDLIEGHRIKEGGEFSPSECKPKYSTAVIVPYRDRAEELRGFLVYMHMFLRRQSIHYRIFVVEQVDSRPFNRAKLLNIGAAAAMGAGYPCLVLHDVDMLPLRPANLYACTKCPRHMSSSTINFRSENLKYFDHCYVLAVYYLFVVTNVYFDHHYSLKYCVCVTKLESLRWSYSNNITPIQKHKWDEQ